MLYGLPCWIQFRPVCRYESEGGGEENKWHCRQGSKVEWITVGQEPHRLEQLSQNCLLETLHTTKVTVYRVNDEKFYFKVDQDNWNEELEKIGLLPLPSEIKQSLLNRKCFDKSLLLAEDISKVLEYHNTFFRDYLEFVYFNNYAEKYFKPFNYWKHETDHVASFSNDKYFMCKKFRNRMSLGILLTDN